MSASSLGPPAPGPLRPPPARFRTAHHTHTWCGKQTRNMRHCMDNGAPVCHQLTELHATCNVDSQQASPTQSFPVLTNGVGEAAFWPNHNAAATTLMAIMVHNIPWLPVEQDKRMNHTLRVHQICIRVWTERRHHVSIIVWSACPWSSAATSSVSSDCTKGARYGQQTSTGLPVQRASCCA